MSPENEENNVKKEKVYLAVLKAYNFMQLNTRKAGYSHIPRTAEMSFSTPIIY